MGTAVEERNIEGLFEKVSLCFDGVTYVTFERLERETGVAADDLVLRKAELERRFREEDDNPDLQLISRMDLDPPGWHLAD